MKSLVVVGGDLPRAVKVAKPDRHLVRIAKALGWNTETPDNVQPFCRALADATGDSVAVVDVVLWRWATLNTAYVDECGQ